MFRPLRLEFAGALYHVMARGNARESIFPDDTDREAFLEGLAGACERFDWVLGIPPDGQPPPSADRDAACVVVARDARSQRGLYPALAQYARESETRDAAMRAAYASGAYTLAQIGEHF